MRCGSSWLDRLLRSHPQVYLPVHRKELHFFDRHYERGVEWYAANFPIEKDAYAHIGEITPKYLHHPEVPFRIKEHLPDARFLVILRNPADRAYSHYALLIRDCGTRRTFQEQIRELPEIVDRGFYSQQIRRYFDIFSKDRFLFLLFENAVRSPADTCRQVADFLSIDYESFNISDGAARNKVNSSSRPRFPRVYRSSRFLAKGLRRCRQGWVVQTATSLGLREFLRNGHQVPPMDPAARERLLRTYESDIRELQKLLGVDLGFWLGPAVPPR
jgi:hypothetical protein